MLLRFLRFVAPLLLIHYLLLNKHSFLKKELVHYSGVMPCDISSRRYVYLRAFSPDILCSDGWDLCSGISAMIIFPLQHSFTRFQEKTLSVFYHTCNFCTKPYQDTVRYVVLSRGTSSISLMFLMQSGRDLIRKNSFHLFQFSFMSCTWESLQVKLCALWRLISYLGTVTTR